MTAAQTTGNNSSNPIVIEAKLVVLGNTSVGKSSILQQFLYQAFTESPQATIGAAFMKKTVTIENFNIILQIWDTAGQERFRSMAPMYYRNASVCIVVYDVTNSDSFDRVQSWVDELQSHAILHAETPQSEMILVVAGNKSDLLDERQNNDQSPSEDYDPVPLPEAEAYCSSIGADHFLTSAKTGKGITEMFEKIGQRLIEQYREKEKTSLSEKPTHPKRLTRDRRAAVRLSGSNYKKQQSSGCCG